MALVYWLNAVLGFYSHVGACALLAPFADSDHRDDVAATLLRRFAELIASHQSRA
ncbi:MAG TPA: hypothetical protein VNR11_17375 [Xanthobacteraceae bacterium]|nr:hypothetical protein [Xanthobacteraceae bacterium]